MANAGSENFAYRLVLSLPKDEFEISIITNRGEKQEDIHVHKGISNCENIINEIKPDLIVDWGLNYPANIHRIGGGVHRYFLQYSLDAYRGLLRYYKWLRNRSLRNLRIIKKQEQIIRRDSCLFLPNSHFSAKQLLMEGARSESVLVLHNAVDTETFTPASNKHKKELRATLGLPLSDILVIYVAHNLLLKNYEILRSIFEKLKKTHPKIKLLVVGKRRPRRLPENCLYLGELSDMRPIYQACDVLVHPTYFDSCSNVVLEAMSSGLPVISSNRCGANELIEDNVSGLVLPVVPNGSAEVRRLWEEKIIELSDSPERREELGAHAREAMLKNDFKCYLRKFVEILRNFR